MSFPSLPARYSLLSASALGLLAQKLWQLDEPLHYQLLQLHNPVEMLSILSHTVASVVTAIRLLQVYQRFHKMIQSVFGVEAKAGMSG